MHFNQLHYPGTRRNLTVSWPLANRLQKVVGGEKALSMLEPVQQLSYVIVLCDDIDGMKNFYRELFPFPIDSESNTDMAFRTGSVILALRQRTRHYDGRGGGSESPGLQLAFCVSPDEVEKCYQQLLDQDIKILDPPTDQPRGHRTVYFSDPEGNLLEIYAEI